MSGSVKEYTIKYADDFPPRFEDARINAELVRKTDELHIPMTIERIEMNPSDVITIEERPELSTPEVAVFTAKLTDEVLGDENFYDRIDKPVEVDIYAKPVATMTMALMTAGDTTVRQHCRVKIEPPKASIHWRDSRHPEVQDALIEVEADARDQLELEVWVERYLPKRRGVDRDDTVHFSHMTSREFRPKIFGPMENSLPWIVARKGSGNRRDRSRWGSKTSLPNDADREDPPITGAIHVNAWRDKDIVQRPGPNVIKVRDGATPLADVLIPVTLGLVKLKVELTKPSAPIPLDGGTHELELAFSRVTLPETVSNAQVSWEWADEDSDAACTLEPAQWSLVDGEAGRVHIKAMTATSQLRPQGRYRRTLRAYQGAGTRRRHVGNVVVNFTPSLDVKIAGRKRGLSWPEPYLLRVPPDRTPSRLVGHLGVAFEDPIGGRRIQEHSNDTAPLLTVSYFEGEQEVAIQERTTTSGTFTWDIPELAAPLAGQPESRTVMELRPFDQDPRGIFDDDSRRVIGGYYGVLLQPPDDKVLSALLQDVTITALRQRRRQMAERLAGELETECEKVWHGTNLVRAALEGGVRIDEIHRRLIDEAIEVLSRLAWDVVDLLMKVFDVGKKIAEALAKAPAWLATALPAHLSALIEAVATRLAAYPDLAARFRSLQALVPSTARLQQIGGVARQFVTEMMNLFRNMFIGAWQWMGGEAIRVLTTTGGREWAEAQSKAAAKVVDKVTKMLAKWTAEALGGALQGVTYESLKDSFRRNIYAPGDVAGAVEAGVDHVRSAVEQYSYELQPPVIGNYHNRIAELEQERQRLQIDNDKLEQIVKVIDYGLTGLTALAALATLVTAGWTGVGAAGAFAMLSTAGWGKTIFSTLTHGFEGYYLAALAGRVVERYRLVTIALPGGVIR